MQHKSTFTMGRLRSSDQLESLHPSMPCKKCGACFWHREAAPLTWSCVKCGNLVYIELGQPRQQISVILESLRKAEYKETDQSTIVPVSQENSA